MKFACSMGFLNTADRMVWPPSLSRDRKWSHVTKSTNSRVVGLRLEDTLVVWLTDGDMLRLLDAVRATIPVGEECVINLDTSEAGQGRITCRIGSNVESDVDIDIVDNGDGTISVMYTPRQPGAYTLEIKFGGQTIPNGTFTQQVMAQLHLSSHRGRHRQNFIYSSLFTTTGSTTRKRKRKHQKMKATT